MVLQLAKVLLPQQSLAISLERRVDYLTNHSSMHPSRIYSLAETLYDAIEHPSN